ncbi:MAG: alpha/beta hydrolase [Bacteroidota bacterium]
MQQLLFFLWIGLVACSARPNLQNDSSMESWQYPYPVKEITISDSISVAYIDEGPRRSQEQPVLLFVHGLGSNLKAWNKNIEVLRKDYRCIAVDLPGYGRSSQGDYLFTMDFFARSLAEFIQQLQLERVVLIGHSMGGQICMHLAIDNLVPLEKLILVAPAGFETFSLEEVAWFSAVLTPAVVQATTEEQIVHNFEINFVNMPDDARFMIEDRMELRASEAYTAYCEMIPKCVKGMLAAPVFDRLGEIEEACLVFYGTQDQLIPNRILHPDLRVETVAQTGLERLPNAHLELLPEAGHFVQWEATEAMNESILRFLGNH